MQLDVYSDAICPWCFIGKRRLDKVLTGESRIEQEGAGEGIAFNFRGIKRMPNTRNAHRLSIFAAAQGVQTPLVEQLFQLHFIEGQDVGDLDTLAEAAQRAGIDRDVARDFLAGNDGLPQMLEELQFALEAGISGVPCFVINREFGIPGAQPVEVLSRYFTKAKELEALVQR